MWEYPLVSIKNKLFGEMAEKGWLLRDKDGKAYEYAFDPGPFGQVLTQLPNSGLVDFTNPEAWEYWCGRHKELFDAGVDCIKADFGEQVLPDMYACNGDDGIRIHNVYSLLYNLCVYEAGRRRAASGLPSSGRATPSPAGADLPVPSSAVFPGA